jgi:hypothetical protein
MFRDQRPDDLLVVGVDEDAMIHGEAPLTIAGMAGAPPVSVEKTAGSVATPGQQERPNGRV